MLDQSLAKKLGCKLTPLLKSIVITVASGQTVNCDYCCKEFTWEMQGRKFTADFLLMPLGGCEVVLGVRWLSLLGNIEWNF